MKSLKFTAILLLCGALLPSVSSGQSDAERLLSETLMDVSQNKMESAWQSLNSLLARYPNFRLAQLVKGDLMLAHAQPILTLGNASASRPQLDDLRAEARQRLLDVTQPVDPKLVPDALLSMAPDVHYVLIADAARSRLYVFENRPEGWVRRADYYVTIGKLGTGKTKAGDKRSPVGWYTIISHKPRSELEELYGDGAYPLSYPNDWDRREGRNGSGIWIHGVPRNTYSRPPNASDGCVVLSNEDLASLARFIAIGRTPVLIANTLNWVDPATLDRSRSDFRNAMELWRQDWESRNTERLLSHYSSKFQAGGQSFKEFAETKRRVNTGKSWINIRLKNVSAVRYPGEDSLVMVSFEQDYKSNNLNDVSRKRQYWHQENGEWKILYESVL
ncbi:MAG TPA: L,D-transpeptidase family protein [Thiobacillaceae bacterium]|nr:L,D-transpeptidase family protein [Thiobacillaceae bacterium]